MFGKRTFPLGVSLGTLNSDKQPSGATTTTAPLTREPNRSYGKCHSRETWAPSPAALNGPETFPASTSSVAARKTARLEHQAGLEAGTSRADRNRLGQFATPYDLAVEVARYAAGLLDPGTPVRFLDPAVGTGAFYSALLRAVRPERIHLAVGFETDGRYADTAERLWGPLGLRVTREDFTKSDRVKTRANLVLANPPYVRHHHLDQATKTRLRRSAYNAAGMRIGGLAGLWAYFVAFAHEAMADGAAAAWVLPGEFMDVNYASEVRRYLTETVQLVRAHRFDPEDTQFDGALVSSAVVVFKKAPPGNNPALFTYGGGFAEPRRSEHRPAAWLRKYKWAENSPAVPSEPNIGDLFDVRRGLVTGCNSFFVMKQTRAVALGLPAEHLRPVLPSPKHLPDVVPVGGPPDPKLVLFDCAVPEGSLHDQPPALVQYLQGGEHQGVPRSYLLSRRTPWWRQEHRPAAPFLCVYMGRDTAGRSPFRFVWNRSGATATNAYLLLYPKGRTKDVLEDPHAAQAIHQQLNNIPSEHFRFHGRTYGGGLRKVEPSELRRLPAGEIGRYLGIATLPFS